MNLSNKYKRLLMFTVFLLFIATLHSYADEYYDIDNYEVKIDISEKNVYDVTEKIQVSFKQDRHGMFRKIPEKYYKYAHKISNIRVTDEMGIDYKTNVYNENGYKIIKIGSSEIFVNGLKTYFIHYNYDMGEDDDSSKDEIYWNVIGTEWNCNIHNAKFNIELPKSFDYSKVNFTSGYEGSRDNTNISWITKENDIYGFIKAPLSSYQALTIAIPLPEGYFVNVSKKPINYFFYISIMLIGITTVFYLMLFVKYKWAKSKIVKTVTFKPPFDLSPSDMYYLNNNRIISPKFLGWLIIYWASKGFLKISDYKDSKKNIKLTRLRTDVTMNYKFENTLFSKIFSYGNEAGELSISKLKKASFTKMVDLTKKNMCKQVDAKYPIYNLNFDKQKIILVILSCITLFVSNASIIFQSINDLIISSLSSVPVTGLFIAMYVLLFTKYNKNTPFVIRLVFGIFYCGMFLFGILIIITDGNISSMCSDYNIALFAGAFGLAALSLYFMPNAFITNELGNKVLGEIYGFKEFLVTAEKDELEKLLDENPTYFFDILPYAIALGVTKKWSRKFKDLDLQNPDWYSSDDYDSNSEAFIYDICKATSVISKATTPIYNSSSGNSGSGFSSSSGGSSGGGGGGGGGESW